MLCCMLSKFMKVFCRYDEAVGAVCTYENYAVRRNVYVIMRSM